MIIVIARQHGAGGTTVMGLLLKRLPGMRKLEMGKKFRVMAKERGMSIDEFSKMLNENPTEAEKVDRAMDSYQKEEVGKGNIIVNSNLGAMVAPNADLKVLLTCDLEVRAKRVLKGGRRFGDSKAETVEEMERQLAERDENDRERYMRLYGFDMFDKSHYDLIIDTSEMAKNEVVQKIIEELKRRAPNAF